VQGVRHIVPARNGSRIKQVHLFAHYPQCGHRQANIHPYSNKLFDSYADIHSHIHTDSYSNGYADVYANGHPHIYPNLYP